MVLTQKKSHWVAYVSKELVHSPSRAYIEVWMHLGGLLNTRDARVGCGCVSSRWPLNAGLIVGFIYTMILFHGWTQRPIQLDCFLIERQLWSSEFLRWRKTGYTNCYMRWNVKLIVCGENKKHWNSWTPTTSHISILKNFIFRMIH